MDKKFKPIYIFLSVLVVVVLVQSYLIFDLKNSLNPATSTKKEQSVLSKNTNNTNKFFNNFNAQNPDPFDQIKKMQEQMQKSFGSFNSMFADDPFFNDAFSSMGVSPLSDMKESKDSYIIELNIPGSTKQDIKIETKGDVLRVEASSSNSSDTNSSNYIYKERFSSKFVRSFTLPKDADMSKITDIYKDGVLKITILKKQ